MVKRIQHITEDGIEKKRCGKCNTYKSLDTFNNCKTTWDKLRPTCKDCLGENRIENKEKITEYNKTYWQETKEEQKEKSKKWREENKEYIKEKMKEWLEANKDNKKQKDKEYRETHKEQTRKNMRIWKKKNYEDMKTNPDRREEFINHKIKSNIGRRIREMLKQTKSNTTMKYVGCTLEELKVHLESLFFNGMTWDNYGSTWHIDHKIPCDAFDMTNEKEVKACFYYKNLQPLFSEDNIRKKNTYDPKDKEEYMKTLLF
jgi:hypothetical protein